MAGIAFSAAPSYTDQSVKSIEVIALDPTPPAPGRAGTRARILAAAETLARTAGPANLSLDAVASQAGVSKGGLLYHFPSKNALMEALVNDFIDRLDRAVRSEEETGRPNAAIHAYIAQFRREACLQRPPPSGLLAALAEDPGLLKPVRLRERDFLDRIRNTAKDVDLATVAYLVINAIQQSELLDMRVLTDDEQNQAIEWLCNQLAATE